MRRNFVVSLWGWHWAKHKGRLISPPGWLKSFTIQFCSSRSAKLPCGKWFTRFSSKDKALLPRQSVVFVASARSFVFLDFPPTFRPPHVFPLCGKFYRWRLFPTLSVHVEHFSAHWRRVDRHKGFMLVALSQSENFFAFTHANSPGHSLDPIMCSWLFIAQRTRNSNFLFARPETWVSSQLNSLLSRPLPRTFHQTLPKAVNSLETIFSLLFGFFCFQSRKSAKRCQAEIHKLPLALSILLISRMFQQNVCSKSSKSKRWKFNFLLEYWRSQVLA